MRRTSRRPLPAGRIEPTCALIFGIILAVLGAAELVWAVNLRTTIIGSTTITVYMLSSKSAHDRRPSASFALPFAGIAVVILPARNVPDTKRYATAHARDLCAATSSPEATLAARVQNASSVGSPHSVSYGARYIVVSWSTSPSRTRSSHPTRPRTFLLIDASTKKYTVETVVTPRTEISTSCPNASKLLFAVRKRFKVAFAESRPRASANSFLKIQNVAPVSMLAARRTLFSPAFNTTGTEMPSRSLP